MGYRNITVDGVNYRWKVGREFVEIRNQDSGTPFSKILVKRPKAQKRWGVIRPQLDQPGLEIRIFENPDHAETAYQAYRKGYEGRDDRKKIELVTLPAKTVSITPEWIKAQIQAKAKIVAP